MDHTHLLTLLGTAAVIGPLLTWGVMVEGRLAARHHLAPRKVKRR